MKLTVIRTAVALAATAALVAGCSDDSDTPGTTATTSATASPSDAGSDDATAESTDEATPTGDVDVLDVTYLRLPTAADTLHLLGLAATAVDTDGNEVAVDDEETTWLVVDQDPIDGTVPAGTVVTLTVQPSS